MDFKTIVSERYATKKFDGVSIKQDEIDALLELIRLAPSSLNMQPWHINVIADAKTKEKLSPLSWNQPQITTCSHLLVFSADKDLVSRAKTLKKRLIEKGSTEEQLRDYFSMIDTHNASMNEEQGLSWAQRQLYLAVGNAVNGAKSLGFDSCPMEGFDSKGYAQVLGLAANIVPTALVAVGYAADTPRPKIRLAKEDIFF